jgi:Short repeat of unknown function (DUF308)
MQRWGPHKNLNKEIFLTPVYCSHRMVISWFDPTYTGIIGSLVQCYVFPQVTNLLRIVQIGLGILTLALSVFALAFPVVTYISIIWVLAIVLLFVGIEQIIVGIFSPRRSKWSSIGLGFLFYFLRL